MPMALVLIKPDLDQWKPGDHTGTFRGNNLAFVAAAAALDYWRDDALAGAIALHGRRIGDCLAAIAARHAEHCSEVRGIGMIQGLVWRDPLFAAAVSRAAFARGLIAETCGPDGEVTKLLPPLVIAADELNEGLSILSDAADEVVPGQSAAGDPADHAGGLQALTLFARAHGNAAGHRAFGSRSASIGIGIVRRGLRHHSRAIPGSGLLRLAAFRVLPIPGFRQGGQARSRVISVAEYAGGVSSHEGAVVKLFALLANMKILVLFRNELSTGWKRFFLLAALSGAANAAVLAAINNAAAHLHEAETRGQAFLIVIIGVLVFVLAQRALLMMAANLAEGAVYRLRVDLLERIRSAELPEIEALNRNQIYTAVNADMQVIAGGAPALMVIGQSALLVMMTLMYVALLSVWAFVLAVVLIIVAVALHLARSRQMQERFAEAGITEMQAMDGFTDLIEGFKEVKLSAARSDELAASVRQLSEISVMKSRLAARALFATDSVISQAMFFLLTALMVFVVPMFTDLDQETLIKIATTSLFLIGPLTGAVSGIPVLQRVNAAAASILAVESRLSEIGRDTVEGLQILPPFERIAMQGVAYQYPAQDKEAGFSVGPIDLENSPGRGGLHHRWKRLGQIDAASQASDRALFAQQRDHDAEQYASRAGEHKGVPQPDRRRILRQSPVPETVRPAADRSGRQPLAVPVAGDGGQDQHRQPCLARSRCPAGSASGWP